MYCRPRFLRRSWRLRREVERSIITTNKSPGDVCSVLGHGRKAQATDRGSIARSGPLASNDVGGFFIGGDMVNEFEQAVFEGRLAMPLQLVNGTIDNILGQCERRTGGQFHYRWVENLTTVNHILGAAGIDGLTFMVGHENPGLPGWDYYTRPTEKERRLWRDIGNALIEWLSAELDNYIILELVVNREGRDASGILKSPHESQEAFDRAAASLLAFYENAAEAKQLSIDDWKEHIPADYWLIIDMWREGYTGKDIADTESVKKSPGTIQNIVSGQRKRLEIEYGKEKAIEIVPYH